MLDRRKGYRHDRRRIYLILLSGKQKLHAVWAFSLVREAKDFLRLNAACPRSTLEDALGRIKSAAADNPILCKK